MLRAPVLLAAALVPAAALLPAAALPPALAAHALPAGLAPPGTEAVVLFFVATDCPISNRTFPEMRRVREEFGGAKVSFLYVYPNATERGAEVARHQAEYDPEGRRALDPAGELTKLAGARVTPEVAVLVPAAERWKPVYTGRIDDRYVRLGEERPQATAHFAESALRAIIAHRAVEAATGTPVGCAIIPAAARSR